MGCWCEGNKRAESIEKVRELAKMAAKMEGCVFLLIERSDGTFFFAKEGEYYTGEITEYIYP